MSDAWIPVVYYLIAAVSAGFAGWLGARYGSKSTENKIGQMNASVQSRLDYHDDLDKQVMKQVEIVHAQNTTQTQKLDVVHESINGRLEQWRNDMRDYVRVEVEAALSRGKAAGVEQERVRQEDKK